MTSFIHTSFSTFIWTWCP